MPTVSKINTLHKIILISFLSLFVTFSNAQSVEEVPQSYIELIDWLTENSNAYSGLLNERQTWVVSYDGYMITDEYYWDNRLKVRVQFDIRDIAKATNEIRFYHSVALYPESGNTTDIQVTRFEEGVPNQLEGDYYNLMIDPAIKKEAHKKMVKALEIAKATSLTTN